MIKKFNFIFVTMFSLGRIGFIPGTFGSLATVIFLFICFHILNISPPLNMEPRWFGPHVAYTMAKYGMSLCVLGMAEEFKTRGIAVNALWPKTTIATSAVRNLMGGEEICKQSRKPDIMADAAHHILTRNSKEIL